MASPILMPDLDMDSTAEAKEYTGPVDPSDVAATTRKRKTEKKKKISYEKEEFYQHGFRDIVECQQITCTC